MISGVEAEVNENHINSSFVKFGYDPKMLTWFGEISRSFPSYRGVNNMAMRALPRSASIGMVPQQVRESFTMKERWIRIESVHSESHTGPHKLVRQTPQKVQNVKTCSIGKSNLCILNSQPVGVLDISELIEPWTRAPLFFCKRLLSFQTITPPNPPLLVALPAHCPCP